MDLLTRGQLEAMLKCPQNCDECCLFINGRCYPDGETLAKAALAYLDRAEKAEVEVKRLKSVLNEISDLRISVFPDVFVKMVGRLLGKEGETV